MRPSLTLLLHLWRPIMLVCVWWKRWYKEQTNQLRQKREKKEPQAEIQTLLTSNTLIHILQLCSKPDSGGKSWIFMSISVRCQALRLEQEMGEHSSPCPVGCSNCGLSFILHAGETSRHHDSFQSRQSSEFLCIRPGPTDRSVSLNQVS